MTQAFGDSAVRCCSLAAQMLGWRPAEFWSATPAELATALRPYLPSGGSSSSGASLSLGGLLGND